MWMRRERYERICTIENILNHYYFIVLVDMYLYIRYVVPAYPHGKNACVYVCYNLLWSNFDHWATTSLFKSILKCLRTGKVDCENHWKRVLISKVRSFFFKEPGCSLYATDRRFHFVRTESRAESDTAGGGVKWSKDPCPDFGQALNSFFFIVG